MKLDVHSQTVINLARTSRWKAITRKIFFEADTITIRLLLATASLGWCLILLGNIVFASDGVAQWLWHLLWDGVEVPVMSWDRAIFGSHALARPAYDLMRIFGNDVWWAAVFLVHFAGVVWRLYDPKARPIWALVINAYGCFVWVLSTSAINWSVGFIPPGSAMEWTLCAAAAWALYRTGLQPEVVTL